MRIRGAYVGVTAGNQAGDGPFLEGKSDLIGKEHNQRR